jgi:hypothetical protein
MPVSLHNKLTMLHLNEETVPTTLNHSKEVKAKAHKFLDTLTDILSENEYYSLHPKKMSLEAKNVSGKK